MVRSRCSALAACLSVALMALLAGEVQAGCLGHRRAHPRKLIAPERRFHNHQPVRRMAAHELPKAFSWANVTGIPGLEGTSLLQPSWWETRAGA